MRRQQNRRRQAEAEAIPLDPIALSIAIWLGLAVSVAGLIRLAHEMPAQAPEMTQAAVSTIY